jgi:diaminopimelate decarboxylase
MPDQPPNAPAAIPPAQTPSDATADQTNRLAAAFPYRNGAIHCGERVGLAEIAARYGTPTYVYSGDEFVRRFRAVQAALSDLTSRDGAAPLICYSVKSNSNLAVMRLLDAAGAGFDIVSVGELARALEIGVEPGKIVFAGVGKGEREMRAALEARIGLFNVESIVELDRLDAIAGELGLGDDSVRVALRLNPDIDPGTHDYISTSRKENKFGIDLPAARDAIRNWRHTRLRPVGLHLHIGSQIAAADRYSEALEKAAPVVRAFADSGRPVELINLGGGFRVDYERGDAHDFDLTSYSRELGRLLDHFGRPRLLVEPGRYISAAAGVLIARLRYVKEVDAHRFCICDAGMSDLIRPSLYQAHHTVWPVAGHGPPPIEGLTGGPAGEPRADVVGPICESGDFLLLGANLPTLEPGELLAVYHAGAYAYTMASNYNTRPRPAEVLVTEAGGVRLVRRRETIDDLLAHERDL